MIGDFLHIPHPLLDAWKKAHENPLDCIKNVLDYWFCNPEEVPPTYSVSWAGLYQLLVDAQLNEFVAPLKKALANAQCQFY